MIKTKQQNSGFILKLDEDSEIKEVIFNSRKDQIRFDSQNFSQFIDPGSLKKYFSILKEAREKEVVFGREINLQLGEKTESYIFIVLNNLADESILIAANQSEGIIKYYEELMKINNNYVNNLRRTIKDKIEQEKPVDDEIYNEMSRLNNELVNLQRQLNKQNLLLKAEKEKYRITLSSIAEGVITADQDDLIVYLNSKAEEMLGWTLSEARGKECTDIFKIYIEENNEHDLEIISDELSKAEEVEISLSELLLEKGEINNQEALLTPKNNKIFPIEFSAASVEENQGKVIIFRDISERKDMEARLRKYAATDLLTEVLNRRAGLDYLQEEMEKAAASEDSLSIIFIDVNDLKLVNDNFGHQEGDELLQKVSDILQHSLRRNDKVVRLGGDEFLLVLPQSDREAAEKIWLRIRKKFKQATAANSKDYKIAASHGAAEYSPDYQKDLDQLINEADHAMYKEKKKMKSAENIR
ncbi:sensor domain-containing diguanylate cyclase [Halanaerobium sp.]|uniref:sensor domain-containing diguanylate cyclase n=1 Tax=Halanaerobium sp. TaxID=1895664 RepID=UPI000DE6D7A3|nr:sensor domain-containing diguanylate cyclase [Halanaerobium sp.]PUU95253.1 MAG: Diguanylate cyclase/phosphodiesterase domain 2 [Halanaerobium sp.]